MLYINMVVVYKAPLSVNYDSWINLQKTCGYMFFVFFLNLNYVRSWNDKLRNNYIHIQIDSPVNAILLVKIMNDKKTKLSRKKKTTMKINEKKVSQKHFLKETHVRFLHCAITVFFHLCLSNVSEKPFVKKSLRIWVSELRTDN